MTRRQAARRGGRAGTLGAGPRRRDVGEPVRVGMLGCGAVGTGVARLLVDHAAELTERAGRPVELRRVAVRDLARPRDPAVDPARLTDDPAAVVADPDVDLIVEAMGGSAPAYSPPPAASR